jgi:hypothetical protein
MIPRKIIIINLVNFISTFIKHPNFTGYKIDVPKELKCHIEEMDKN